MKKLLFILAFFAPLILSAQDVIINMDPIEDSTWQSIELDTLYFSKDTTYITGDGDSIQFVVDDQEALRLFDNAGTAQALFGDGSAAAPGMGFISEAGLGIYRQGAQDMGIVVNSGIIMRFSPTTIYGLNNGYLINNIGISSTIPIWTYRSDQNTGVNRSGPDSVVVIAGGVMAAQFAEGGGKIWTTLIDTTIIEEGLVPDANEGADIGLDAYRFNLIWADTVHANNLTVTGNATVSGSLAVSGVITGGIPISLVTAATLVISDLDSCRGMYYYNNNAVALDATLPGAAKGLYCGFYDRGGAVITVDLIDDTDIIELNGTPIAAGNSVDSPGNAGDFLWFVAIDDTHWTTAGRSGVWIDGGP